MAAIERCRTAVLGAHVARCKDCAYTVIAYNSCRKADQSGRAQMEGGIGFRLGAALHGAITLKDGGRADQLQQLSGAAH